MSKLEQVAKSYSIYSDGIVATTRDISDIEVGKLFIVESKLYEAERNTLYSEMPNHELSTIAEFKITLNEITFDVDIDLDEDDELEFDTIYFTFPVPSIMEHQYPDMIFSEDGGLECSENIKMIFSTKYELNQAVKLFKNHAKQLLREARA